jgi:hypothetical protein
MVSPFSRSGGKFFLLLHKFRVSQFSRFANRSARFISAYQEGLSGAQAAWANKKYHGHRTLPPEWILAARDTM